MRVFAGRDPGNPTPLGNGCLRATLQQDGVRQGPTDRLCQLYQSPYDTHNPVLDVQSRARRVGFAVAHDAPRGLALPPYSHRGGQSRS